MPAAGYPLVLNVHGSGTSASRWCVRRRRRTPAIRRRPSRLEGIGMAGIAMPVNPSACRSAEEPSTWA
jgi:hypothetical protein